MKDSEGRTIGFTEPGVRLALATSLYREESLSLGQAARLTRLPIAEFMQHVSRLGIPVIRGTAATVGEDVEAITAWGEGSSRRPDGLSQG